MYAFFADTGITSWGLAILPSPMFTWRVTSQVLGATHVRVEFWRSMRSRSLPGCGWLGTTTSPERAVVSMAGLEPELMQSSFVRVPVAGSTSETRVVL